MTYEKDVLTFVGEGEEETPVTPDSTEEGGSSEGADAPAEGTPEQPSMIMDGEEGGEESAPEAILDGEEGGEEAPADPAAQLDGEEEGGEESAPEAILDGEEGGEEAPAEGGSEM